MLTVHPRGSVAVPEQHLRTQWIRGNVSTVTLRGWFFQGDNLSIAALCRLQSVSSDRPHFCFIFMGLVLGRRVYFSTHNPLSASGFIYSIHGRIFRQTLIGRMAFVFLKFRRRAFLEPHFRARSVPFFLCCPVLFRAFISKLKSTRLKFTSVLRLRIRQSHPVHTACHPPPSGPFWASWINFLESEVRPRVI